MRLSDPISVAQLRVHCAEGLGCAIIGDSKYSPNNSNIQVDFLRLSSLFVALNAIHSQAFCSKHKSEFFKSLFDCSTVHAHAVSLALRLNAR